MNGVLIMFYRAVAATCPGNNKEYNSNNIYLNSKYITEEYKSSEILLRQKREQEGLQFYAISEGFGAERYADEASLLTVKKLAELQAKVGADKISAEYDEAADILYSYMEEFVNSANESVTSKATELSNRDVLASVAAVAIYENAIITCNLGNTRIFLFRKGKLSKLSEEQNHAYMMFKNGIIDETRLQTHSKRNKLTQYLGILPDEMQPEPYYSEAEVKHGDIFVICSSSFCDNVSEESLCEMIKNSKSLSQIIDKMMTAAAEKGFEKDTSVMVIRADSHEKAAAVVTGGAASAAAGAAAGVGAAKASNDKNNTENKEEASKGTFLDKVKNFLGFGSTAENEKIWPAIVTFVCCILVVIVLAILGVKIYNASKDPGSEPTKDPISTIEPTSEVTGTPTDAPVSSEPTEIVTEAPTQGITTEAPTETPAATEVTTQAPATQTPTRVPTQAPATPTPTRAPTQAPVTQSPTQTPTVEPTQEPTAEPATEAPTAEPTAEPTETPSEEPTEVPATEEPVTTPEATEEIPSEPTPNGEEITQ